MSNLGVFAQNGVLGVWGTLGRFGSFGRFRDFVLGGLRRNPPFFLYLSTTKAKLRRKKLAKFDFQQYCAYPSTGTCTLSRYMYFKIWLYAGGALERRRARQIS